MLKYVVLNNNIKGIFMKALKHLQNILLLSIGLSMYSAATLTCTDYPESYDITSSTSIANTAGATDIANLSGTDCAYGII